MVIVREFKTAQDNLDRMDRTEEILVRLLKQYKRTRKHRQVDPFRSLISTILSQNTNSKNQNKAYNRLENLIGITPEKIANASLESISEAILSAGMYRRRSKVIKNVARIVKNQFSGDLTPILKKSHSKAREILMSFPGVGPKTADVFLMFTAGKKIVPVDRHIFRISKRLQIVQKKTSYDQIRTTLENSTPCERFEDVHVLLIHFGRTVCKAQRPKCGLCFLRDLCPFPKGMQE